ncbi:protein TIME FOR COFFEE-like isoform X2 [Neltuma alba]|uniref:protein TIME FOR COFFEE-like isoform X2 n=1 Tax=Neltuma alba TaxID=207710 RepID=UPI0010A4C5CB|nr:protein TIME FOR COFFEE-like isoform X2 [Prosopis alba]
MDQTREASILRRKHQSFDLKDSSFEEGQKVDLQETVKLRPEIDHNGDSFPTSKRKRDPQRKESVGNEQDCEFSHRIFASDHNQHRNNGVMGVVVPKKARSSNNSVPRKMRLLKTSKSSPATKDHIETEIAELLYGLKTSRNQDTSGKIETNEKKKVDLASKSSTSELVKTEREKADDYTNGHDTKPYAPNKDIKQVNLESIDLMAPACPTVLSRETRTSALEVELIEDKEETKMDTFKKNQDAIKIDINVPNKDNGILTNHQVNKTVSPAWSRNLPPPGYVQPSLRPTMKTDKTIGSSSTALQLVDFVLSPQQSKRCASHHYIARNIFLHQQLLRVNSSALCGTKPNNVNDVPTLESLQNDFLGAKKNATQVKKELVVSKFPSLGTNKTPDASNSLDSMQMEQEGPCIKHQPYYSATVVTSHARGGNSSCAFSSNNSIRSFSTSLVTDAISAAKNSSTSIGLSSSSSHKQSCGVQIKAINMLSSPEPQMQQSHPHMLMAETWQEKSPSIVGQKNVYNQNLTIPIQPKDFSFRSSIISNSNGGKKQEALKGGFELVSSQSFAISFHSQPSVAWQGYYSAWKTNTVHQTSSIHQDDEKKVNSGKSSTSGPTTLVFDDSSKYLSFVLSPENGTWLDHSMVSTTMTSNAPLFGNASRSQHLLQLQKQHYAQQQQQLPMATQYKASNNNTSAAELPGNSFLSKNFPHCNSSSPSFHSKSSRRALDSQHFPKPKVVSQEQGRVLKGHAQISFGGNYNIPTIASPTSFQ